jgi:hypothetical protein
MSLKLKSMAVVVVALCFAFAFALFYLGPLAAHEDMAHIRVGHFVAGGPNVDVFLDGEMLLTDFAPASVSDYREAEPGQHTAAIAPTGEGIDKAVIGPLEVTLEAEHNYSISAIGQITDDSLKALVIDETAEMAGCDMSNSVFRILINNVDGLDSVSFYESDMWLEKNIEYGSYSAACAPSFFWDTGKAVVGEDLDNILFDFDSEKDGNGSFWEPYTVYFWGLMGKYPGTPDEDYMFGGGVWHTVAPDPVTFLAAFKDKKLTYNSQIFYEFETAIAAIKAAGLEEMLTNEGPYTIFVPVDQAFAALPQDALDSLLQDPAALKDLLLYHIVEGTPSYDEMAEMGALKTLQGGELTITPSDDDGLTFRVNDATVAAWWYPLPNGSNIWFVDDAVFMPSAN